MANELATAQQCKPLFALMDQIKTMAPWQWMMEHDLFAVQAPDAEEPDFVSVMGMAGEHYAIGLYLGLEALFQFLKLQQHPANVQPLDLLQIPQLQASFEDRDQLQQQDRDRLKTLGLKYRGKHAWPLLRSYRPGCLPWLLEPAEALRLQLALEQLLVVAPRFQADQKLLHVGGTNRFLVRVGEWQGETITWHDEVRQIKPPQPRTIRLTMDLALLAAAKQLPRVKNTLEADLYLMEMPIHERGERPYFPYQLLIAESQSGTIVETQLLQPLPNLDTMWSRVPLLLVQTLTKLGVIPAEIQVSSPMLKNLLEPLQPDLGFKLKQQPRLRAIDGAKRQMRHFLDRF